MSTFIAELMEIAQSVIPEADHADIAPSPTRGFRLSWKTLDDPERPSKRAQPVMVELHPDFMDGRLPQHVTPELRKEFASFIRAKRAAFNPRTTRDRQDSHTADHWIFPPEC